MHSLQPRERDMLNQHHLALVVPASEKFTVALPRRKPNSEYRSREHLTEQVGEMIEFINGSGLGPSARRRHAQRRSSGCGSSLRAGSAPISCWRTTGRTHKLHYAATN